MKCLDASGGRPWKTLDEVAELTGMKVSWLRARAQRGDLPGLRRFGRLIRIDYREFLEALDGKGIE